MVTGDDQSLNEYASIRSIKREPRTLIMSEDCLFSLCLLQEERKLDDPRWRLEQGAT